LGKFDKLSTLLAVMMPVFIQHVCSFHPDWPALSGAAAVEPAGMLATDPAGGAE
jgi:hypothetical protein